MILRQETIDEFGYDPVLNPPVTRQSVVWKFPCCGAVVKRVKLNVKDRCVACAHKDVQEAYLKKKQALKAAAQPTKEVNPLLRTEVKYIHGQLVEVKVYSLGAPVDYIPRCLE